MLLLVNQPQREHDIAHSFIEMCKNVTSNEFMYDIFVFLFVAITISSFLCIFAP